MQKGLLVFSLIILVGNLGFGLVRPVYTYADNTGIGYNRPYPSIQVDTYKLVYGWNFDLDKNINIDSVYLSTPIGNYPDPGANVFFQRYLKQKLTFAGIRYYYPEIRNDNYGSSNISFLKINPDQLPGHVLAVRSAQNNLFMGEIIPLEKMYWNDIIDLSIPERWPDAFNINLHAISGWGINWFHEQDLQIAIILPENLRGRDLYFHIPMVYTFAEIPHLIQSTINAGPLNEHIITSYEPLTISINSQESSLGMINLKLSLVNNDSIQTNAVGFRYIIISEDEIQSFIEEKYYDISHMDSIDISKELFFVSYIGFSNPEGWGRWAISNQAIITINIPEFLKGRQLFIEIPITHVFGDQRVQITLNDNPLPEMFINKPETITFIATEEEVAKGSVSLVFNLPDAVSPLSIGLSNDPRLLSIGFKDILINDARQ